MKITDNTKHYTDSCGRHGICRPQSAIVLQIRHGAFRTRNDFLLLWPQSTFEPRKRLLRREMTQPMAVTFSLSLSSPYSIDNLSPFSLIALNYSTLSWREGTGVWWPRSRWLEEMKGWIRKCRNTPLSTAHPYLVILASSKSRSQSLLWTAERGSIQRRRVVNCRVPQCMLADCTELNFTWEWSRS